MVLKWCSGVLTHSGLFLKTTLHYKKIIGQLRVIGQCFQQMKCLTSKLSMVRTTAVVPNNETTTILFTYKHIVNKHDIIILYDHYKNVNYPFLFFMKMVGLKRNSQPEKPIHS